MRSVIPDGDCLCNRPLEVTFIEILGQRIGLSGVEDLFRRWQITDREPPDLSDKDVLTAVREKNYVSGSVARAYVEAVRTQYATWLNRSRKGSQNAES